MNNIQDILIHIEVNREEIIALLDKLPLTKRKEEVKFLIYHFTNYRDVMC